MPFEATVTEISSILGSSSKNSEQRLSAVVTDSREAVEDSIFLARIGETMDGHNYIESAYSNGARGFIVSEGWYENNPTEHLSGAYFFPVSDADEALADLARAYRDKSQAKVLCVTGSNGKTTTKEILGHVLKEVLGQGTRNIKSYNNHVGLPQTILESNQDDKWLVLEAGMNHLGELTVLSSIAKPDVAIILNVAPAHIGHFESVEQIAKSKCELLTGIKPGGVIVLNSDDERLNSAYQELLPTLSRHKLVTFGKSESSDLRIQEVWQRGFDGCSFKFCFEAKEFQANLPLIGAHNAYNAASCLLACCLGYGLKIEDCISALERVPNAPMRLEQIKVGKHLVINDTYNANPQSVLSAISSVESATESDTFAVVLGDMFELGSFSKDYHQELGQRLANSNCSLLLAVGPESSALAEAAQAGLKKCFHAA